MRKSRTFLDRYSLENIYISFIRPLMEYADVIWDNQKQNVINKLENIQLDAGRIVTGGTRLTSHDSLYEETKWEKLKDRRNNHRIKTSSTVYINNIVYLSSIMGVSGTYSFWN
jgi:hypothetical protein